MLCFLTLNLLGAPAILLSLALAKFFNVAW